MRMMRLRRLFGPDGRCVNIALDHGLFGERTLHEGLEDPLETLRRVAEGGPDAVQLAPGQVRWLEHLPGRLRPALVLRVDFTNAYAGRGTGRLFSRLVDDPVELALRSDAACVVVNVLWTPTHPELYEQSLDNVCRLVPSCARYGMPLMVEPLALRPLPDGGFGVDGNVDRIAGLVRQAVELGADVIKADPCDDLNAYWQVIQAASGRPVLLRGGGKVSEREILERTSIVLRQGAAGVVYGRNVFQHPNPKAMTRALVSVVHEGAAVDEALRLLQPGV